MANNNNQLIDWLVALSPLGKEHFRVHYVFASFSRFGFYPKIVRPVPYHISIWFSFQLVLRKSFTLKTSLTLCIVLLSRRWNWNIFIETGRLS